MIMIRKIALPLLVISALSVAFIADTKTSTKPTQPDGTGFAIVELFTSEGCSSCPPADALLAKVAKESKNKPVYLMAYHVDYWDRLGWKDSFSSAKFSARQNQYANWLNLKTVYTPQMVVNGTKEFVGSEENILRNSIKAEIGKTGTTNLQVLLGKISKNNLTLNYHTYQRTDGFVLTVALITSNATNQVLRGENKGKKLSHVQIVRQLDSFTLQGKTNGTVNIQLSELNAQMPSELIAFLQDNKTGRITAATRLNDLSAIQLAYKSR